MTELIQFRYINVDGSDMRIQEDGEYKFCI